MDTTAKRRWDSKLKQHHAEGKNLFNKHKHTDVVVEELNHHLGVIISDWTSIFRKSWTREAPKEPGQAAAAAIGALEDVVAAERERTIRDFKQMMGAETKYVHACIDKIDASLAVNRDKALEIIDDARAERAAERRRERSEVRRQWINALVPLCAGAMIAMLSAWLSNRSNERKAINDKRIAVLENVGRTQPLFVEVMRSLEFLRCSKLSDEERFSSEREIESNQRHLMNIGTEAEVAVVAFFDKPSAVAFRRLGKFYSDSIDAEMAVKKCEKSLPAKYSKEGGARLAATINAMSPLVGERPDFVSEDDGSLLRRSWGEINSPAEPKH